MCLWYDIIEITRLLHMIYVLWLVLDGNSSRAVAAIWLYTLCDRYSITSMLGYLIDTSVLGLILLNPLLPWLAVPRR